MPDNELSFSIKSGLKNIIGRDLITDDFIAVFELVKNSFDAYANNVTIIFKKNKIIIIDDGKGMDLNDINEKWLAVAYSAKKDGVEDDELENDDFNSYRNKIQAKKFFAGAKGIGRFSCDRLGNKLILTSKKASKNSKIEQIEVNWQDFEKNSKDEFISVKVKHRTIVSNSKEFDLDNGTKLEITNLNSTWDRDKKRQLKHSLEKLINPFEDNPLNGFSISIIDESEIEADKDEKNKRNRINGEIQNFVFETLDIKTTQIITEIDHEGKFITTTLRDRGILIYKIKRKNNTQPKLSNISFHLFHLNRIAKTNFTRLMGLEPIHFGSIFLYKNGFRIAPYGDVGFDYLGLDTRKTQKHFDLLGSRDLIGRIEIIGNNPNFKESSSRDGGLVRNEYYHSLVKSFINDCLKKLENYLNKVQWTNKEDKNKEDLSALNNILAKSALLKLISSEVDDNDIELLDTDRENLNIRAKEILDQASSKDIDSLQVIARKLGDKTFDNDLSQTKKEHQEIIDLQKKIEEERKARIAAEEQKQRNEEELEAEKQKNIYLLATRRTLSEDADGLIHTIKITNTEIRDGIDNLIEEIIEEQISGKQLINRLGDIKVNAERSLKLAEIATRSDFKSDIDARDIDVVNYIIQYLEIYKSTFSKQEIEFEFEINESKLLRRISVLNLSIVIDNLISNSLRWKASHIKIIFKNNSQNNLQINISDNGLGFSEKMLRSVENIFDLGFGDTPPNGIGGSGIGLYYTKKLLTEMDAEINFIGNNKDLSGASFEIIFK